MSSYIDVGGMPPLRYTEFECQGEGLTCHSHCRANLTTLTKAIKSVQTRTDENWSQRRRHEENTGQRGCEKGKELEICWGGQVPLYKLKCEGKCSVDNCRRVFSNALAKRELMFLP